MNASTPDERAGRPAPDALFDIPAASPAPASGVTGHQYSPASSDAALTGDGYGWLAALLPAPVPPACETCGQPMRLPSAAPVLWACPACHPAEAAA